MVTKTASDLANLSILYKTGRIPSTPVGARLPTASKTLNDRITLHRGDITALAVDAIVNAANQSLLGGGGVDGAIHRGAGRGLLQECRTLGGCRTGSAKITNAYNLPCNKVIHAVGPVYDVMNPETSEAALRGCYNKSLELAVENGCKTIAFSAISTGVYGYPSREAASVAIQAVKQFLEGKDGDKIGLAVFVVFELNDLKAYHEALPEYLPPVAEKDSSKNTESAETADDKTEEARKAAQDEAEAKTVASELPDVPKDDPADAGGHADKRQKQDP